MLAAGMSYEDAQELCELEALEGRVCVAASNSLESVTISGDADAIELVQGILEDESRFARLLKVDKAYHSHHMLPCSSPYIEALTACGCAIPDGKSDSTVAWYSSVYDNKRMRSVDMKPEYWRDNLVSPVLISQAIALAAFDNRPLDAVIEIGPHPALKGPCLATLKDCGFPELPYTGCLQRFSDDMDAFAGALGYIWEHFGLSSIDSDRLISETSGHSAKSLASILPQYPWDHSRTYWTESRITRHLLHGKRPHLLLGRISPHSSPTTFQWHNFIRPRDIDWLDGHGLQGQTVFPAAGYIVMAFEAAMQVASDRKVQLLEIINMDIKKAVTFEDENSLVELNLTANMIHDATDLQRVVLDFVIDSCLTKENELSTSARGQLIISFGPLSSHVLPPAEEEHPDMRKVNMDNFYLELEVKGYNYSKDFRRVLEMKRADSKSTGTLAYPLLKDGEHQFLIHPAALDLSLQTVIGAYSSPGDNRLRSLYVPTHIDRLALVPSVCLSVPESLDRVQFNSVNTYDKGDYLAGDIQLFVGTERESLLQIENMVFKPFSPLTSSNDHRIFSKWVWGPLTPEKLLDDPKLWATDRDKTTTPIIERIVYFYSKFLLSQLTNDERLSAAFHHKKQISWAEHVVAEARQGRHQWYDPSWEVDSHEHIQHLCER
jgi:acyl transferase domain-containing protein